MRAAVDQKLASVLPPDVMDWRATVSTAGIKSMLVCGGRNQTRHRRELNSGTGQRF